MSRVLIGVSPFRSVSDSPTWRVGGLSKQGFLKGALNY